MRLSILIATMPSRRSSFARLLNALDAQTPMAGGKDIEILLFIDNHKRSIGMKRQALLDIAKGDYVMWCDSDDELTGLDEIYQATLYGKDVICFKALCRNEDGSTFIVDQQLGHPIEHNSNGNGGYADIKRPPFQNCAWQRELVKDFKFPDSSYGEDYEWLRQCYEAAKTQHVIGRILYKYNFDPSVSEAPKE